MVSEPKKRISERALKVWRISGAIYSVFTWMITIGITTLSFVFSWPSWIFVGMIVISAVYTYFSVMLIPFLRWKKWRYEVRDQEIELQYGVFIIRRTLVPMIRVQHVDTQQGPLLRKYHLATVTISTAATIHEIPALDMDEADELRFSISRLARVADEDV